MASPAISLTLATTATSTRSAPSDQPRPSCKKKYVVTWMDTASTSVMVTEGEADGKTITSRGEVDEPAAGPDKKTKVRTVITIEADKHTYEIFYTFAAYPDSEFRALEVVYERKK